tara:strand:- start:1121 stop:2770 length:1650 start_codon:yes stop_codon:yes gene_type:complete
MPGHALKLPIFIWRGKAIMVEKYIHKPCPCGESSDAFSHHKGPWYKCFSCNKNFHKDQLDEEGFEFDEIQTKSKTIPKDLLQGQAQAIKTRGITKETCEKFGYFNAKDGNDWVQAATYYTDFGEPIAQKVRTQDKKFRWVGEPKKANLFGQHLWGDTEGKRIVLTEGEIDCLTIAQVFGLKWPVCSLTDGAQSAVRNIKENYEFLNKYSEIVLFFDSDPVGREAAKDAAQHLPAGKVKIANLSNYKDANEALVDGKSGAVTQAVFEAKVYAPDGIKAASEFASAIHMDLSAAASIGYPYQGLNELLGGGLRPGELVVVASGSGSGKTSLVTSVALHLHRAGEKLGLIMLEESNLHTIKRLVGLQAGKTVPKFDELSREEKDKAFQELFSEHELHLFDHFGSSSVETIMSRIRYMAQALDCRWIILDHLSIMVSGIQTGDERKMIDVAMTSLRTLVQELGIGLIAVTHLSRPAGSVSHEDGKPVQVHELRGSHSVLQLADVCIAMNKLKEDPHGNFRELFVLKNRFTGQCGSAGLVEYNPDTGSLSECPV